MARFSTTAVAVSFFCLLTLTLAGDPTENDESSTQVVTLSLSESANPALRLPNELVKTETEYNSAAVSSEPLKRITFKPINRRFHVRSKHPKMRENVDVPYGNDMLVVSGENSDFQEPVLHGEGLRIPGRWVRHLHHHLKHDDDSDSDSESDSDSDSDDEDEDRVKKVVFKRYDHDMLDGEKKLKKLRKRFLKAGEEKKKDGFMNRVRKFLDHYF